MVVLLSFVCGNSVAEDSANDSAECGGAEGDPSVALVMIVMALVAGRLRSVVAGRCRLAMRDGVLAMSRLRGTGVVDGGFAAICGFCRVGCLLAAFGGGGFLNGRSPIRRFASASWRRCESRSAESREGESENQSVFDVLVHVAPTFPGFCPYKSERSCRSDFLTELFCSWVVG